MRQHNDRPNPLLKEVLAELKKRPQGLREYDLLNALEDHSAFRTIETQPQLALFQKHFLLMNALYQLRSKVKAQGLCLQISPLNICLHKNTSYSSDLERGEPNTELNIEADLSGYYLDWNNLTSTSATDVQDLLDNFWKRFFNVDARQAAFDVLQLECDASNSKIRQRYRELVAHHHPDKGGETEEFVKVREAYEVLKP